MASRKKKDGRRVNYILLRGKNNTELIQKIVEYFNIESVSKFRSILPKKPKPENYIHYKVKLNNEKYVGMVGQSNNYGLMEILEYINKNSIKIKFLDTGNIYEGIDYRNFKCGEVKDTDAEVKHITSPHGELIYPTKRQVSKPAYMLWKEIVTQEDHSIPQEWLEYNKFYEWYDDTLDKIRNNCGREAADKLREVRTYSTGEKKILSIVRPTAEYLNKDIKSCEEVLADEQNQFFLWPIQLGITLERLRNGKSIDANKQKLRNWIKLFGVGQEKIREDENKIITWKTSGYWPKSFLNELAAEFNLNLDSAVYRKK